MLRVARIDATMMAPNTKKTIPKTKYSFRGSMQLKLCRQVGMMVERQKKLSDRKKEQIAEIMLIFLPIVI